MGRFFSDGDVVVVFFSRSLFIYEALIFSTDKLNNVANNGTLKLLSKLYEHKHFANYLAWFKQPFVSFVWMVSSSIISVNRSNNVN